ncbi:MAG: hypothetical protein UY05_C0068G0003 [Candidatus Peregrinibacteria bacterium GW2011_GWA2_47_7]|nr:MAG: hypothetical protein UY05_C0068G0003 [Candidatus Peregrinibacteria bacterium GW2011_GWA2_47_7]
MVPHDELERMDSVFGRMGLRRGFEEFVLQVLREPTIQTAIQEHLEIDVAGMLESVSAEISNVIKQAGQPPAPSA